ncbi:MAG: hypothetical protein JSW66_17770 [Phycisphaerales bacterium]|nr:MAG: hypothetical protein JSW66_17770 [Phycisphaerales bacterium]
MELREWIMYTYASDKPVKTRGKQPFKEGKEDGRPVSEGSKYTILSVSLPDCELTWCFGPGISTIFIVKDEFPHDLCVLSRQHST